MAVTRAQRIERDRKATEAFMEADPLIFDGYYPEELHKWKHTIDAVFISCRIEEHLQVYLASMRLAGHALTWWIQQRGTSAHASWEGMCKALRQKYDVDALEQEEKMNLYQARSANWRKSPEESVEDYARRFREQIMEVQPREIPDQTLIYLFWDGLPEADRPFPEYQAPWADIYHFICSVLYAVKDFEPTQPEPTPMEHNVDESEEEEDLEEDVSSEED